MARRRPPYHLVSLSRTIHFCAPHACAPLASARPSFLFFHSSIPARGESQRAIAVRSRPRRRINAHFKRMIVRTIDRPIERIFSGSDTQQRHPHRLRRMRHGLEGFRAPIAGANCQGAEQKRGPACTDALSNSRPRPCAPLSQLMQEERPLYCLPPPH